MKGLRPFVFIRNFFSSKRSESYILISGGLTAFFLIFIINAVFGIYSIFRISLDMNENLKAIDLARNAQIALHEQILSWENILISNGEDAEFRKHYHRFSQHSQNVQNVLFNLKMQNSGKSTLPDDIENLRKKHKDVTSQYISHITDMERQSFRNIRDKIEMTRGYEAEILNALSDIVKRTDDEVERNSRNTSNRFIFIVMILSAVFITLIIYYGRQIGRRLLKTQNILETMVTERTKDYVEANLSLQKEIEEHKLTVQKLIVSKNEIADKNALLSISERKYRHIVEGTGEIIFTLDENWFFTGANDAIKNELKISPEAVSRYTLIDLIHDELTDATILRKIITEKLEDSRRENAGLRFNARLKTPNLLEPVEYKITLEFIEIEGIREIIGKAVRVSDDRFSEYFISEKCEYMIKNYLFTADDITHRVTENLQTYLDKHDVNMVRIGLREIIINAIEHGNLNITFEEKTEAILNDNYFKFINERQGCPEYRDRRVRIEYLISEARAVYKVTDQGKGFNYKKFLPGPGDDHRELTLAHGRGISMVKSIFDEVKYNSKGNQVLLVKHLNRPGESFFEEDDKTSEMQHAQIS